MTSESNDLQPDKSLPVLDQKSEEKTGQSGITPGSSEVAPVNNATLPPENTGGYGTNPVSPAGAPAAWGGETGTYQPPNQPFASPNPGGGNYSNQPPAYSNSAQWTAQTPNQWNQVPPGPQAWGPGMNGQPITYSNKSSVVAGVLQIIPALGLLGIGNFYAGYVNRGVIQLVLTVIAFPLYLVLIGGAIHFGVAIWVFIEGIMYLTKSGSYAYDGSGHPLI